MENRPERRAFSLEGRFFTFKSDSLHSRALGKLPGRRLFSVISREGRLARRLLFQSWKKRNNPNMRGTRSLAAVLIGLSLVLAPLRGRAETDPLKEAWNRLPAAEKHFQKGLREFQAGRYAAAAGAFRKTIDALPRHAYASYYLANIAYVQGDFQNALADMERSLRDLDFMRDLNTYAVAKQSQTIDSYRQMLDSEWENAPDCRSQREIESLTDEIATEKNKLEVRTAAEDASRLSQRAHFLYFLGNIRFQLKQFPEALDAYQKALDLNPRHVSAVNNAAAVRYMAGDPQGALDQLDEGARAGVGGHLNLKLKHLILEALGRPTEGVLQEDLSAAGPGADLGVVRFALAFNGGDPLLPPLYENGYVVFSRTSRQAILVDPGVEDPRIAELIARNHLEVKAVFNTHNHDDHAAADKVYAALYKAPVYLSPKEEKRTDRPAVRPIGDGETISFEGFTVQALLTPGHTAGSTCFLIGGYLFSGDTLLADDIGSPAGGNNRQRADARSGLVRVIREKLLSLDGRTRVCPGHGKTTTIAAEAAGNPFLKNQPADLNR